MVSVFIFKTNLGGSMSILEVIGGGVLATNWGDWIGGFLLLFLGFLWSYPSCLSFSIIFHIFLKCGFASSNHSLLKGTVTQEYSARYQYVLLIHERLFRSSTILSYHFSNSILLQFQGEYS